MMKTGLMRLGNTKNKGSNKMWVSLLATLGVSAAVYGLQKYKNGKFMRPIQNILNKTNTNALPPVPALAVNALAEFSKEIAPGMNAGQNQQKP